MTPYFISLGWGCPALVQIAPVRHPLPCFHRLGLCDAGLQAGECLPYALPRGALFSRASPLQGSSLGRGWD